MKKDIKFKIMTPIMIIHFIFYLGCASTMESRFSFTSEGEVIPENQINKSIYINTSTKRNVKVELLSVRSNSIIVLSSRPVSDTSKLYDGQHYISELDFSEVQTIFIHGQFSVRKGFKKGFFIGGALGAVAALGVWIATVIEEQNNNDNYSADGMWVPVYIMVPFAFVIYGICGACIGGVAGGVNPFFNKKSIRNSEIIRDELIKYSRYPLKEPAIFSELFPE